METDESKESYSHILKYTSLFGGIQFLIILIGIVRTKLVAVILGPSGVGLVSLFNSTITFVSNSTNLGVAVSAVKNLSESFESGDEKRLRSDITIVRSWCFVTALIGMLLCILFSKILNDLTFDWGDHTFHFICLSPIVAITAIVGGEMAILKATRRLRNLAEISIYNVIFSLIISVLVYYVWDMSGVVPCLLLTSLSQLIITIVYSYKYYPLHMSFRCGMLRSGIPMVKLGIAFVVAGIFGSGADFAIRSYLNNAGMLETVGLYSAGYMIVMTYGGLIFSAMETDYYPRLSAENGKPTFISTVNRQCEVSLLLISPMLVGFIIAAPLILPILYSGKFIPVVDMMQVATLALFVRAVKLPVAYISLAKGDSMLFLIIECIFSVSIVITSILGFRMAGLTGIGYAIVASGLLEYFVSLVLMGRKYEYRISGHVMRYMLYQFPLGIAAFVATVIFEGYVYWIIGALLIILSSAISIVILYHKTSLWKKLKEKFRL